MCREKISIDGSYAINNQGFRDDKDFDQPSPLPSNKKRIMVLGDSFAFGAYVSQSYTMPYILQKNLRDNYEVYNLAMPGWGVDQMLLAYKKYEPVINPDVVLLIFIDDDIFRTFEAYRIYEYTNKPAFGIENSSLIMRNKNDENIIGRLSQKSRIFNTIYKDIYRLWYSRCISNLIMQDLNKLTKQRNERLMLVRYPNLFEFKNKNLKINLMSFFSDFKNFCKKNHIEYLDLKNEMKELPHDELKLLYLDNEGHPSEKGYLYSVNCIIEQFFKNRPSH